MPKQFQIARGELELTELSEGEVRELLREGFLLPSDCYRTEGMHEWQPLGAFESKSKFQSGSEKLVEQAQQKVSTAGQATLKSASWLTGRLKSLATRGKDQLTDSTKRVLDSFTPQIQKLVSHQLVKRSVTRTQVAIRDDEFMRKVFGATYDCLPKPVYRFVKEEDFIQYCLERRTKLLGLESTESTAQYPVTSQPDQHSSQ